MERKPESRDRERDRGEREGGVGRWGRRGG